MCPQADSVLGSLLVVGGSEHGGTKEPCCLSACSCLTASFSIFKPSSYHIVVNTMFGLRLQIQLVPVMQLFVTLDQSAQGQVQGERFSPVLSLRKPHECPVSSPVPRFFLIPSWPFRSLWELQRPRE